MSVFLGDILRIGVVPAQAGQSDLVFVRPLGHICSLPSIEVCGRGAKYCLRIPFTST